MRGESQPSTGPPLHIDTGAEKSGIRLFEGKN